MRCVDAGTCVAGLIIACSNWENARTMGGGEKFNWDDVDDKFANQMRAAGITSEHHIAIAVSGGADSIALCLLAARWKRLAMESEGRDCITCPSGHLLGLVVDHSLRKGSAEEALRVQDWVRTIVGRDRLDLVHLILFETSKRIIASGLQCEIRKCVWPDGVPASGHLQEAARNARYFLLAQACQQSGAVALLTAHHADDQAELFILRLSRCSGIAGLAGMASFTSLHTEMPCSVNSSNSHSSLLLVRPLLNFHKEDLYKICQHCSQDWVEDPTNLNLTFARNRIRKALQEPHFFLLKKEVQTLLDFCRKLRTILDQKRDKLLFDVAEISQLELRGVNRDSLGWPTLISVYHRKECGHVTVDVQKMVSSGMSDIVLRRVVGAILQFVAQRRKPPRGRAVDSLLNRFRSGVLQEGFTVGGCTVMPAPRSKGLKAIICFSPDSPLPSGHLGVHLEHCNQRLSRKITCCHSGAWPSVSIRNTTLDEPFSFVEEKANSLLNSGAMDTFDMRTSVNAIRELKTLGLLSEIGAGLLEDLTLEMSKDMTKERQSCPVQGSRERDASRCKMEKAISFGESQSFMERFFVSVAFKEEPDSLGVHAPGRPYSGSDYPDMSERYCCLLRGKPSLCIRHFEEKDWLHLSNTSKGTLFTEWTGGCTFGSDFFTIDPQWIDQKEYGERPMTVKSKPWSTISSTGFLQNFTFGYVSTKDIKNNTREVMEIQSTPSCSMYRAVKAKEALAILRTVPKPVRRGLPVLATAQGLLLAVPFAGFKACGFLSVKAIFSPRYPLGGGQASWD